jgi:hypothetical protein
MGFFLKASKRGGRGAQKKPTRIYDMANQQYVRNRERLGLSYKPNRRSQNNPFYLVPVELQRIVNAVQGGLPFKEPARVLLVFWENKKIAEERLQNFPRAFMTEAHIANYDFFVEASSKIVVAYLILQAYGAEKLLESLMFLKESEGVDVPEELLTEVLVVAATAQAHKEITE